MQIVSRTTHYCSAADDSRGATSLAWLQAALAAIHSGVAGLEENGSAHNRHMSRRLLLGCNTKVRHLLGIWIGGHLD